jgi:hypothetical protein
VTPTIVPATAEMIMRFTGEAPRHTVRALAAVLDGEPLAIAGVHCDGKRHIAFASVKPVMRERYRKTGLRMARQVIAMWRSLGVPVFAVPDERIEAAPRFLRHLGFREIRKGVYAWTT